MGVDEEGTRARLQAHFAELVHPKIEEHRNARQCLLLPEVVKDETADIEPRQRRRSTREPHG